jgi:hypothetical protein
MSQTNAPHWQAMINLHPIRRGLPSPLQVLAPLPAAAKIL